MLKCTNIFKIFDYEIPGGGEIATFYMIFITYVYEFFELLNKHRIMN